MSNESKMTWGNRLTRWLLLYVLLSSVVPLIIEYFSRLLRGTNIPFLMWPSISVGGAGWCILTIADIVNLDTKNYLSASGTYGKIIIFLSCFILLEGLLIMGLFVRPNDLVVATDVFSKANVVISVVVIVASLFVQCFIVVNAKKKRKGV